MVGPSSAALARLTVEALVRAGVSHVVLCPGSRSAPLAYVLDQGARDRTGPFLCVRHDERVAAFTALGVSRGGATAAGPGVVALGAVVTTSGTAAANLHPAVLEAHHADVPLVVVTADRPPRLRGTWANQTSELQSEVFGDAVRARIDLDDATTAGDPDAARAALDRVLAAARGGAGGPGGCRPGPVHLNLGFDDPLVPDPLDPDPGDLVPGDLVPGDLVPGVLVPGEAVHRVAGASDPLGSGDARPDGPAGPDGPARPDGPAGPDAVAVSGHPVVLGGAGDPGAGRTVVVAADGAGPLARCLAERAGWPLLAEPSSGARCGPNAVGAYRLLLEHPGLGGRVRRAVVFGRPTLSRPVARLLADPLTEVVLVSPCPDRPGPGRPVTRVTEADVRAAIAAIAGNPESAGRAEGAGTGGGAWLAAWREAGTAAVRAVDRVLDDLPGLAGPLVAREVLAALGPADVLVVAASNAVRDLDLAGHPTPAPDRLPTVLANRGLAGIDGTLSTATGVALALAAGREDGRPPRSVRVLTGDLAFLHDLNALLPGAPAAGDGTRGDPPTADLQIVVVNDRGGGIFSLLEHGARAERGPEEAAGFERCFGTPHEADLAALCRGYRVPHTVVHEPAGLREALVAPLPGRSVVEVPCSRGVLRDLHDRVRRSVVESVPTVLMDRLGPLTDQRSVLTDGD